MKPVPDYSSCISRAIYLRQLLYLDVMCYRVLQRGDRKTKQTGFSYQETAWRSQSGWELHHMEGAKQRGKSIIGFVTN